MSGHELLEIIYFLCSPILVLIACIGLYQLKLTKDARTTTAKREALTLAAEQCCHYQTVIEPLAEELERYIKDNDLKFFDMFEISIIEGGMVPFRKNEYSPSDVDKELV